MFFTVPRGKICSRCLSWLGKNWPAGSGRDRSLAGSGGNWNITGNGGLKSEDDNHLSDEAWDSKHCPVFRTNVLEESMAVTLVSEDLLHNGNKFLAGRKMKE